MMIATAFLLATSITLTRAIAIDNDEPAGIITLPLLNHDQVVARRRRELRLLKAAKSNSTEDESAEDEDDDITMNPEKLYQGMGTHYVDLWVGVPTPQRQTLIVDTGSDITAFPCEPCQDCGKSYHTDSDFKDEGSSTFFLEKCGDCRLGTCKKVDEFEYCGMTMSYAEGSSWNAYEARDYVYIGGRHDKPEERKNRKNLRRLSNYTDGGHKKSNGTEYKDTKELEAAFKKDALELESAYEGEHQNHPHSAKDYSFELRFGCQYKITGLFKTQLADGIMGMENSDRSFWRQMYKAGMIASKRFALCFIHSKDILKKGSPAGAITLGGADKRMHTSPMIYAENRDLSGWFSVNVNGMYLKYQKDEGDDKDDAVEPKVVKINLNFRTLNKAGVIVDSGTTESFFPSFVKVPFMEAFKELMGFDFLATLPKAGAIAVKDYPTIMIQLKAAVMVEDDELMDENDKPLAGMTGALDLDAPNDVLVEIPPEHYMLYRSSTKSYTNRFHMTDSSGFGVLGANSMYDHDILFDAEKNRIGYAKSKCSITKE